MGHQRQPLGWQDGLGDDRSPVTPVTNGRLSICKSGLRTALAPGQTDGRAQWWMLR